MKYKYTIFAQSDYEEEQIVELQYRIKSGSTLTGMKRAVAKGRKLEESQ